MGRWIPHTPMEKRRKLQVGLGGKKETKSFPDDPQPALPTGAPRISLEIWVCTLLPRPFVLSVFWLWSIATALLNPRCVLWLPRMM